MQSEIVYNRNQVLVSGRTETKVQFRYRYWSRNTVYFHMKTQQPQPLQHWSISARNLALLKFRKKEKHQFDCQLVARTQGALAAIILAAIHLLCVKDQAFRIFLFKSERKNRNTFREGAVFLLLQQFAPFFPSLSFLRPSLTSKFFKNPILPSLVIQNVKNYLLSDSKQHFIGFSCFKYRLSFFKKFSQKIQSLNERTQYANINRV